MNIVTRDTIVTNVPNVIVKHLAPISVSCTQFKESDNREHLEHRT
ncbi:hypothetical protein JCM12107_13690 [Corynebacterium simulans]